MTSPVFSIRQLFIIAAGTIAFVSAVSQRVEAQATLKPFDRWEFNLPSGAFIPTGAQSDVLKNAAVTAAQLSYVIRPQIAITTTFGWARSRDLTAADDPKLDVFTYDVGVETRMPRLFANDAVAFSPFAGIGAGGRSYNYRNLDVDATGNLAAYGTAGGELAVPHIRVRLEVRNYVAGFKPLTGVGAAETRRDLVAMLGFRFSRQ